MKTQNKKVGLMKLVDVAFDKEISSLYDEINIEFSETEGPIIKGRLKSIWDVVMPGKSWDLMQ